MFNLHLKQFATLLLAALFVQPLAAQHSVAREWNEALLQSMREDLARPHVQARNIFHFSVAMYDAWAAYDNEADPYLLGKTVNGFSCPFKGVPMPADVESARKEAMSFAAYRFLLARFVNSPQSTLTVSRFRDVMTKLGYDPRNYSSDYTTGSPAALGSYIAQCVLQMGGQDDAKEGNNYQDANYHPLNLPLDVVAPGAGKGIDPNHWQALKLKSAIDLDGYPVLECNCLGRSYSSLIDSVDKDGRHRFTGTQIFQGSEWGRVKPFALKRHDRKTNFREGRHYFLYHDPGNDFSPRMDTVNGSGTSKDYRWNYALVAAWSALLNPEDTTRWEVSPGSMGNVNRYPQNLSELPDFYGLQTGRDPGTGHSVNPRDGQPYAPTLALRGDYIRAAVQYWAEGPNDETPPGHWLALLNYVSDRPELVKKFNGKGRLMSDLEWDVKTCFTLGAALHDAAIAAWGIKGWYDGARPITALRYMATRGQSTDPTLPSYHPAGIPLMSGRIELVKKGDPLAGPKNVNLGKIKFFAWKGPFRVNDAKTQTAGVGWILGENWFPYQPKTFVSPPFAGFVSGHAAFSHSAAEALSLLTGDVYFPGGLGEFMVKADSQFLRIEKGPSTDVSLQWATYRDAADQASLSRIWSGANAPFDDIPGRLIGGKVGIGAFQLAKTYFYKDRDRDGFLSYEDSDDTNAAVH
ncbi:MAG: vanadium-dependent haloperoxidase [Saprospiraceae bacterium]|nr:vanadium-dependent haloperoxidase [Saprospiraceae bacterium]